MVERRRCLAAEAMKTMEVHDAKAGRYKNQKKKKNWVEMSQDDSGMVKQDESTVYTRGELVYFPDTVYGRGT